jgi:hypothetical protein
MATTICSAKRNDYKNWNSPTTNSSTATPVNQANQPFNPHQQVAPPNQLAPTQPPQQTQPQQQQGAQQIQTQMQ